MMKVISICILLLVLVSQGNAQLLPFASRNNEWNADSLGNHRAVVSASSIGIARVVIAWRRPDTHPETKRIIVQDSATGQLIQRVHSGTVDNEKGEIWFDAISGKGEYFIYYMPYKNEKSSNYPKGIYLKRDSIETPDITKIPSSQIH